MEQRCAFASSATRAVVGHVVAATVDWEEREARIMSDLDQGGTNKLRLRLRLRPRARAAFSLLL